MLIVALLIVLLIVLAGPFVWKVIEHNLEYFLMVTGVLAVFAAHFLGTRDVINLHLIKEALIEPIKITLAVLFFGLLFKFTRSYVRKGIGKVLTFIPLWLFVFLLVVGLGLISSVITAIMASLFLVEVISGLKLDREDEINLVIISCFSIGLGAALTPIGEPLSTIAIAKLRGEPHNAGFFYLVKLLGAYIIPGILALGVISIFYKGHVSTDSIQTEDKPETLFGVLERAFKVYVFVMALIFLGTGFKPVIDMYVSKWSAGVLYWVNTVSAILDNATLTSAEIGPTMTDYQIKSALMGLIIAGGMLIPGNIPNIISASKLKIGSVRWAKLGVPLGFIIMAVYFVILIFLH
jgi:predicted cation transporter